jgi:hypothetical protein
MPEHVADFQTFKYIVALEGKGSGLLLLEHNGISRDSFNDILNGWRNTASS